MGCELREKVLNVVGGCQCELQLVGGEMLAGGDSGCGMGWRWTFLGCDSGC